MKSTLQNNIRNSFVRDSAHWKTKLALVSKFDDENLAFFKKVTVCELLQIPQSRFLRYLPRY